MKTQKFSFYIVLLVSFVAVKPNVFGQQQNSTINAKLWSSIGGEERWNNSRYLMFSCRGNAKTGLATERIYLWDKQTGQCRYEGVDTLESDLVVLFNIKSGQGTVFSSGEKVADSAEEKRIIEGVGDQFKRDASFIFMPTILERDGTISAENQEKLVGKDRHIIANIKNRNTSYHFAVEGRITMDAKTGRVQSWQPTDTTESPNRKYDVSGYKDIGDGLILPTIFSSNGSKITFPLAAALVSIEAEKFTHP